MTVRNLHRARRAAGRERGKALAAAMPRRLAGSALVLCALIMLLLGASELSTRHGSAHLGGFEVVVGVLLSIAAAAVLRR